MPLDRRRTVYRGGVPGIITGVMVEAFLGLIGVAVAGDIAGGQTVFRRITQDVVNRRAVPVAMSRTRFRSRVITAMLASLRALTGTPLNCRSVPGARRSDAAVPQTSATSTTDAPLVPRCLVAESESALRVSPAIAVRPIPAAPPRRSHRHATWPAIAAGDPSIRRVSIAAGPVLTPCRRWHLAQGR